MFNRIWKRLSKQGECDSSGSAEFERVYMEWQCWGKKQAIEQFIFQRSNATVEGFKQDVVIRIKTE